MGILARLLQLADLGYRVGTGIAQAVRARRSGEAAAPRRERAIAEAEDAIERRRREVSQ